LQPQVFTLAQIKTKNPKIKNNNNNKKTRQKGCEGLISQKLPEIKVIYKIFQKTSCQSI